MTESDRLARFVRTKIQRMGQQYEEARREFNAARYTAVGDLPMDEMGRARIVCRRYAEERAVRLDGAGRPTCFDGGHPDCEGCVEDIEENRIETW